MDTDHVLSVCEANREDAGAYLSKAVIPLFAGAVD
jgi:hypothetical protein